MADLFHKSPGTFIATNHTPQNCRKTMKRDVRACRQCGKKIFGRSDKKFCNHACRNVWNNENRFHTKSALNLVNAILKRNRNVLRNILPDSVKTIRIQKIQLEAQGFNFSYFTSACKRKNGQVFFFCYEFGYVPVGNECYFIVKNRPG